MNWYKTAQQKTIEDIALSVRKQLVESYDDEYLQAVCLDCSRELRDELIKNGYNAVVVQGEFELDDSYDLYSDEFVDKDRSVLNLPLHYWVEVDGFIVDITVSQFNDEVEEELPGIIIGSYNDFPRYKPLRKGWK